MSTNTFRVDPTHMGLRVALLAIFGVAVIIGFIIASNVVDGMLHLANPLNIFAIPTIAAVFALGAGWGAEKLLTRTWPSGRTLQVTASSLTFTGAGATTTIDWGHRVNVMTWYFVIRSGRAWVPKGSYCVACQLKQDDAVIVPYAFFSADKAALMPGWSAFPELLARKKTGSSKQEHLLSEIGEQPQLRYAEQDRWHYGGELTPADFIQLMTEVRQHVPDWTS